MTLADQPAAVEFANVRKVFRSHRGFGELIPRFGEPAEVRALDDISFRLDQGRVLGLVGESGSGKSTLANVLVGLEAPSAGKMLFRGRDLASLKRVERRAFHGQVQMVFQDPYASLNPRFTVGQTVEEPLIIHRYPRGERARRVIDALERSELRPGGAFLDKYPHELSGGQRQRVAIARAIILDPSVLVADEPVSMLDVSVRAGILRLLRTLVDQSKMALIFITHDLSLIGQLCDDLMVLYRGSRGGVRPGRRDPGSTAASVHAAAHGGRSRPRSSEAPPAELPAQLLNAPEAPSGAAQCVFAPRCIHAIDVCHNAAPLVRRVGDVDVACHRAEELNPGASARET